MGLIKEKILEENHGKASEEVLEIALRKEASLVTLTTDRKKVDIQEKNNDFKEIEKNGFGANKKRKEQLDDKKCFRYDILTTIFQTIDIKVLNVKPAVK